MLLEGKSEKACSLIYYSIIGMAESRILCPHGGLVDPTSEEIRIRPKQMLIQFRIRILSTYDIKNSCIEYFVNSDIIITWFL